MKSWVVHVGILLALCIAVYFYAHKFTVADPKRKLMAALAGTRPYLRPGQAIHFMCRVTGDSISQDELHTMESFPDFVMAPVRLEQPPSVHCDTTLIIARYGLGKFIRDSIAGHATVIWEHRDSSYHYLLIH